VVVVDDSSVVAELDAGVDDGVLPQPDATTALRSRDEHPIATHDATVMPNGLR
jgi:hypothetical protein